MKIKRFNEELKDLGISFYDVYVIVHSMGHL